MSLRRHTAHPDSTNLLAILFHALITAWSCEEENLEALREFIATAAVGYLPEKKPLGENRRHAGEIVSSVGDTRHFGACSVASSHGGLGRRLPIRNQLVEVTLTLSGIWRRGVVMNLSNKPEDNF